MPYIQLVKCLMYCIFTCIIYVYMHNCMCINYCLHTACISTCIGIHFTYCNIIDTGIDHRHNHNMYMNMTFCESEFVLYFLLDQHISVHTSYQWD